MKELETSLTKNGVKVKNINLGDWDIAEGMDKTLYLHNPNTYARGDLTGLKNADKRLQIDLPDEIGPSAMVPVRIRIAAVDFDDAVQEEVFFKDILDKLSGRVVWRPA